MSEVNYEILTRPFPKEAIKQRQVGNRTLLYVEGHSIIRRLIEATRNNFTFRIIETGQVGDVITATCELTLPGLGSRQHIGVQRMINGAGEDLIKGAITDSLKKCASLFGISLELWGPDYEAEQPQAATQTRPAPTRPVATSSAQTRPAQTQAPIRTSSGAPVNRAVAMAGTRTFRQS